MYSIPLLITQTFYFSFSEVLLFFIFFLVIIAYLCYRSIKYKNLNYRIIHAKRSPVIWINRKGVVLNFFDCERLNWFDGAKTNAQQTKMKEMIPENYHQEWERIVEQVFKTHKGGEILIQDITSSGEDICTRFYILYYDWNSLILLVKDLSEVERERLENRKQRYIMQALMDNLPIPTTVKEANSRKYLIWNKGTEILYSVSQSQLLGNDETVLNEGLATAFRRTDEEAVATGSSSTIQHLKLADEKIHTLSMHKTLATYNDEKWIISSALDITELEEKNTQLKVLNKQHELVLQAMGMVSWAWERSANKIIWYKDPAKGMTSFPEIHLTETFEEFYEIILPEYRDRAINAFADLASGKNGILSIEYQIKDIHNRTIWIETFGIVSERDESGLVTSIVGASYSIEQRKRLQQELVVAKEKAEENNRLKSAFLANMSHEIRTPLNAIVGFSDILAEKCNDQESKEYTRIIERNNQLLLQLINDILDLSKIEAGGLDFVYDNVDINNCLEEIAAFAKIKVNEEIEILLDTPLEKCCVYIERYRVMQIINNFISNAIKHTVSGYIKIGYDLPKDGFIRFYVKDSGRGIPAEKKELVFDRFTQLDSFKQGVGLGLAISKTIVEKMNGKIGVESESGQGSEFWFAIPYEPVQEEESIPLYEQEFVEKELPVGSRATVLIAEDNDSNYKLYQVVLEKEYILHHAWNGKEAVEMCEKVQPDIILMDIKMPVMNGHEAFAVIREKYRHMPVIAVTAHAFVTSEELTQYKTFDAYLPKPINGRILKKTMKALLATRRSE